MAKFPLLTDLPLSDQQVLSPIIAKPSGNRSTYEAAFYAARLTYTYAQVMQLLPQTPLLVIMRGQEAE